jgi:hypothetical protein
LGGLRTHFPFQSSTVLDLRVHDVHPVEFLIVELNRLRPKISVGVTRCKIMLAIEANALSDRVTNGLESLIRQASLWDF